tara:strand:- start:46 stop:1047 length:1002 start_codon:yes stop_codon:yes gene_type:complete
MNTEKNIDFSTITESGFEELCFDLVLVSGYENVLWRKGSADDGRDIEATFHVTKELIEPYQETWYFECKRYSSAVRAEDLHSKIAWAEARKPDHLVIITSSHLSNQCLGWLELLLSKNNKAYRVHVINGEDLKRIIIRHPKIYQKYFASPYERLFVESKSNWLVHGITPSPDALVKICQGIDYQILSINDLCHLVFFMCEAPVFVYEQYDIDGLPSFSEVLEHLIEKQIVTEVDSNKPFSLKQSIDSSSRVGTGSGSDENGEYYLHSNLQINDGEGVLEAYYLLVVRPSGDAIEMVILKTSSFHVYTTYIKNNASQYFDSMSDILMKKFKPTE